ncbi:MAG: AAA family ATPase [Thermoanaerobaculia bacterium]|nr:AAA family ATPase [Thermoanaerobaculia bacterium]
MIELPYGLADFRRIRRQGMVYVDRTAHLRDVELLGSVLVFLRPRRFGKSLWLQTLANYYDLRREGEFAELFGDLAIGQGPTPLRNRYFVLQWNFSLVDPSGGVEHIAASLRAHVSSRAATFLTQYADHLPTSIDIEGEPAVVLEAILRAVEPTPYGLYLLIDEYDNFINEVMAEDADTYRALVQTDGPFKLLFKAVKNATEGRGLERVFITGVSPVALNDLTSGFNIAENVSLAPELAALCGFRESEVDDLLERIGTDRALDPTERERALRTMRTWYNGYRFAERVDVVVYNPTNALYFLKHLYFRGEPPEKLHDENLLTDRGKLSFLAGTSAGAGVIEQLAEGDGELSIPRLESSFSFDQLTTRLAEDRGSVTSFLYYMGLLTLTDVPARLKIPNLVVKKLFLERLLEIHLPRPAHSYEAQEIALRLFETGELRALLDFFEKKLLPVLSNRDRGAAAREPGQSGGVNEMTLKALFLAILFDDIRYVSFSELEVGRRYADLCLLVRPQMRRHGLSDLLFELKLVRRKELGKTGEELREMSADALRQLPAVAAALAAARNQITAYRDARAALLRGRRGRIRADVGRGSKHPVSTQKNRVSTLLAALSYALLVKRTFRLTQPRAHRRDSICSTRPSKPSAPAPAAPISSPARPAARCRSTPTPRPISRTRPTTTRRRTKTRAPSTRSTQRFPTHAHTTATRVLPARAGRRLVLTGHGGTPPPPAR